MLGREGPRGIGVRNITIVVSLLCGYVFGSTAWTQFGLAADVPAGVRVFFTVLFALFGVGLPWLLYVVIKLLVRLFRGRPPG